MERKESRGCRNNNPGNVEKGEPWQGLADEQPDPRFCTFRGPEWGIRAIARILIRYYDHYDINTISGVIARWAPSFENDTAAYIKAAAKRAALDPNEPLNLQTYEALEPLVKAIIWHENGYQPYPQAVIDHGLTLAGVRKPLKPLAKSGTVKAASAAGVATVATPLLGSVHELLPYVPYLENIAALGTWVMPVVALGAVGWIVWTRIEDRKAGLK
jgi:hypothetical protein